MNCAFYLYILINRCKIVDVFTAFSKSGPLHSKWTESSELPDFAGFYIQTENSARILYSDMNAHTKNTKNDTNTESVMPHIVLWWVRVDRVLCSEGDAAHSDDRQDAELKILQSQDVVTAPPKPGANTHMYAHVDTKTVHKHTKHLLPEEKKL